MTNALGIAIIAVVAVLIVYRLGTGLRRRSTAMRQLHGPLGRGGDSGRRPGSASEIADGGQTPARELFAALRVTEVPELDSEGEPNDIAGLGLRLHEGTSTRTRSTPQVMEGTRNGHQVFIRQGHVGDTVSPGVGARRLRHVTVVRVEMPEFELAGRDGTLTASSGAPGEAIGVVSEVARSPDVWHDLRVVSGPTGIVASRGYASDWLGGWIYDLWLLERIAAELGATPLANVRLTRSWTVPYGMGDWAPSALSTLRGEG